MLTKFDEFHCHQIVDTLDHVLDSDRQWTEKYWMNVHDKTGEVVLATGFGVYPNRNVMDGYGCVNIDNKTQHNMRLSRELRPQIQDLKIGRDLPVRPIPMAEGHWNPVPADAQKQPRALMATPLPHQP